MNEYRDNGIEPTDKSVEQNESKFGPRFERRALTFMAFINVGQYIEHEHLNVYNCSSKLAHLLKTIFC